MDLDGARARREQPLVLGAPLGSDTGRLGTPSGPLVNDAEKWRYRTFDRPSATAATRCGGRRHLKRGGWTNWVPPESCPMHDIAGGAFAPPCAR